MGNYIRRIVDAELDDLLAALPAVLLDGPKGVGKTETAARRSATKRWLDDAGVLAVGEADPGVLLTGDRAILLDEWHRLPTMWDAVRRAVDGGVPPGSFLLTGSAPRPGMTTHSGAGRIAAVRMRPMILQERRSLSPTTSLARLLSAEREPLGGESALDLSDYVTEIVRSGLPGLRGLEGRALRTQLDGYVERIVDRDIEEAGLRVKRPATFLAWLRAYAAATATTASWEKIRDAATGTNVQKPAKTTVIPYVDVLTGLRILDPVPAWLPSRNRMSRLTHADKHHLADPALAARLLGVNSEALLEGAQPEPRVGEGALLGRLFESLATLTVRVLAQANECTVHHLRTREGRQEIDLIVERPDGGVVAIEVKLSPVVTDRDVRHLHWLREQIGDRLFDAIVVTTGRHAFRRPDGIGVVPLALLGP